MLSLFAATTLTLAATTLAAPQNPAGMSMSSQCTNALLSAISNSDFASCTNVNDLLPLVTNSNPDESVIPSIQTWLSGFCQADKCSSSTLQTVSSSIESGCGNVQEDGMSLSKVLSSVQENYSDWRDSLCLQQSSNSSYCVIEVLTSAQTYLGQDLSVTNIKHLAKSDGKQKLQDFEHSGALCTDCGQALINDVVPLLKDLGVVKNDASTVGKDLCGSNFSTTVASGIKPVGPGSS